MKIRTVHTIEGAEGLHAAPYLEILKTVATGLQKSVDASSGKEVSYSVDAAELYINRTEGETVQKLSVVRVESVRDSADVRVTLSGEQYDLAGAESANTVTEVEIDENTDVYMFLPLHVSYSLTTKEGVHTLKLESSVNTGSFYRYRIRVTDITPKDSYMHLRIPFSDRYVLVEQAK